MTLPFLVALISVSPSPALVPQRSATPYALRAWAKREGLPDAWVSAILPSSTGYLWLGAPDGLVRFDGARFTIFNKRNAPGLPGDGVRALHETSDGRLWVGTSRGLAIGDGRGAGPFQRFNPIPSAPVGSMDEDADGSLWILVGEGVWRVKGDQAKELPEARAGPGETYSILRSDPSGGFWLGGSRGLKHVGRSGGREVFGLREGLPSADVLSLLVDRVGGVWVGTGKGAARRTEGRVFERVPAAGDRIVMALVQDREGNVWAATRDGVLRVTGRSELLGRAEGLPDEHAHALAADASGNLWIGTEAGGLVRLRDSRAVVYGMAQGLGHEVIWSVSGGRDGSIWVATDGGGLDLLREGRARLATSEPGLAHEKVYALLEDRSGAVWFSTESHGLCRLSAGRVQRQAGIADEDLVRCLMEDGSGGIWAGTSSGLLHIGPDGVRPVASADGKGLTVEVLSRGPAGELWVGTSSGLARLERGVVRRVLIDGKAHAAEVDALHCDEDGTLWIGTVDAGLQRLRTGRLTTLASDRGLPTDTVLSVLDDGAGRLWISAVEGIFGLARADLDAAMAEAPRRLGAVAITEADGLRDRECSGGVQPSAWRAADGRLYYPTIAGVAVVDPRRARLNVQPLRVFIEGVVADGRRIPPNASLDLPAGTRHLEIEYSAPTFVAPERVRFETRLGGLEKAFFAAGTDRVAHYSGLAPGSYRFQVRAANEDGVWSDEGGSLKLSVRPHLWQSRWFYALSAGALLLAVWTVVQVRTRALRIHEEELQRRVAEEMAKVRILSGMLPICAWCKKVRDDAGYWKELEAYIRDHSEADFTHGICPQCRTRVQSET